MSKTWFKIIVKCPHCHTLLMMQILKNAPPLCPMCDKPMNIEEEKEE